MTTTILDLDSALDATLDTVANIPDYVTPPAGTYMLSIPKVELVAPNEEGKKAGKPPRIVITYSVASTVETEGAPVADGSLFTEGFNYEEKGLEYFKRSARNLLKTESVDGVSLREIFAALMASPPIAVVLTVRTSPGKEKGQVYENVNIRVIPDEAAA